MRPSTKLGSYFIATTLDRAVCIRFMYESFAEAVFMPDPDAGMT